MSLRPRLPNSSGGSFPVAPVGVKLKAIPRCTLDDDCPICLDAFYTDSINALDGGFVRTLDGPFEITTNCGHVMHRRCFLSLVTTGDEAIRSQCPQCKTPFDPSEIADAREEAQKAPPPPLATLTRARRALGLRPPSRQNRRSTTPSPAELGHGYLPSLARLKA